MMEEQFLQSVNDIRIPEKELHTRDEALRGVKPLVKEFQHTFIVTASTPRLRGLRAFLESNHYEFTEDSNANV